MKDYLFLFRGGLNFVTATAEELQQAMAKWKTWMDQLAKDGKYNGGDRLVRDGSVMTGKERKIMDGPFSEGKEIVGGYISIKADNLQAALEIAKGCPIFNYDGSVEVREIAKNN